MKYYVGSTRVGPNYSVQHGFNRIFSKVETVFFCFLSLFFLITSRINEDFYKEVSFIFVEISMPVVEVTAFPFNTAINLFTNFKALVMAKEENEVLKKELEDLRKFYIKAVNIDKENQSLRQALNFASTKSVQYRSGKIIAKSHQIFNQKVMIGIGKNEDVQEGNVVIANDNMIGRIVEVGDNMSRVMLITDAGSHIPVITSNSRVRGILAGDGSGLMEIEYLPKDHEIKPGDRVFTSGDGDMLPAGLPIGVVKKVGKRYAAVQMMENINDIDIVTILHY